MVGVPGRSKGCSTCRRRKKKCDLQEPTCGNCTRGKFVCGGYRRDMIIVHVGPEGKQGVYRAHNTRAAQPNFVEPISPIDARLRSLNQSAFEMRFSDAFWNLYLPKPGRRELFACYSDPEHVLSRWAMWMQMNSTQSSTLKTAVLAVSSSIIGSWRQDPSMERCGMEFYGESLANMAIALKNPKRIDLMEMISTCILLALYEILSSAESSTGNWQGHINGMIQLVHLQAPETFASDGLHELFQDVRFNAVVAAIDSRKATWLAEPDWIEKPFKGQLKGAVSALCDILVVIPGLLEEFDRITIAPFNSDAKRRAEKLKYCCWILDGRLQGWYRSQVLAIERYIDPIHAEYISSSLGKGPPEDLPDILARYGMGTLYGMMLYCPACLILYGLVPMLYRIFPSPTKDNADFTKIPRMDILTYTRFIARSVKHFFKPGIGVSEAMAVSFPICCITRKIYYTSLASPDTVVSETINDIIESLDEIEQTAASVKMRSYLTELQAHLATQAGVVFEIDEGDDVPLEDIVAWAG